MHRRVIAIAVAAAAGAAQAQPAPAAGTAQSQPAPAPPSGPGARARAASTAPAAQAQSAPGADPMPPSGPDADADAAPTAPTAQAQPAPGADPMPPSGPEPGATTTPPAPGVPGASPSDSSPPPPPTPIEQAWLGDQLISVQAGLAAGGRVTPGGLEIAGHYLYELSDRDWFDGTASFVYGSGQAACFRDRRNDGICHHGLTDGDALEITAAVRRIFPPRGAFVPFARAGLGLGFAQFSDDDVSGFIVRLHGGGGVRAAISRGVAIVADGDLVLGLGAFNDRLGTQPQLGLAITAGVEFRLQ